MQQAIQEEQMSYTELASSCDGGDCPKVTQDDETGQIGIRGRIGHLPNDPEVDVWMSLAEWETILSRLGR